MNLAEVGSLILSLLTVNDEKTSEGSDSYRRHLQWLSTTREKIEKAAGRIKRNKTTRIVVDKRAGPSVNCIEAKEGENFYLETE